MNTYLHLIYFYFSVAVNCFTSVTWTIKYLSLNDWSFLPPWPITISRRQFRDNYFASIKSASVPYPSPLPQWTTYWFTSSMRSAEVRWAKLFFSGVTMWPLCSFIFPTGLLCVCIIFSIFCLLCLCVYVCVSLFMTLLLLFSN